jgi:hypothetical protein
VALGGMGPNKCVLIMRRRSRVIWQWFILGLDVSVMIQVSNNLNVRKKAT